MRLLRTVVGLLAARGLWMLGTLSFHFLLSERGRVDRSLTGN